MNKDVLDSIFKRINFSMKNKVPVIIQSESTECGNACLSMICGFYGKDIDLFNFRNRYGSTSQGATLNVLAAIAQKAGLKTRALSLDIAEIKELRLPCILHWSLNHFVVLVAIKGKRFIIHDPALGDAWCIFRNYQKTSAVLRWRHGLIATFARKSSAPDLSYWT